MPLGAGSFISCSNFNAPSDKAVKDAISLEMNSNTPRDWCSVVSYEYYVDRITSVEIEERGNFNKKGEYWPIKAWVHGICYEESLPAPGKAQSVQEIHFGGKGDFHIFKDDYGKWKSKLVSH